MGEHGMGVLVVTGGFGVLGMALGKVAASAGWHVALVDRTETAPAELAGAERHIAAFTGADLLDEAATLALFSRIEAQMGGIDALANVAGGFTWITIEQAAAWVWRSMQEMNVLTALSASRAALSGLKKSRGSIVNVGANAALHAAAGMGPYTAAKAGVHRLTEALAEELRPSGVRVNAVLPSIIDTPANRRDMPDADKSAWVAPEDLARVILFLASAEASAVNGALVPVTK
jgi:NAD(P)-dependent dehydrogenase (short-subunit alcohol dehydrogenase family)